MVSIFVGLTIFVLRTDEKHKTSFFLFSAVLKVALGYVMFFYTPMRNKTNKRYNTETMPTSSAGVYILTRESRIT